MSIINEALKKARQNSARGSDAPDEGEDPEVIHPRQRLAPTPSRTAPIVGMVAVLLFFLAGIGALFYLGYREFVAAEDEKTAPVADADDGTPASPAEAEAAESPAPADAAQGPAKPLRTAAPEPTRAPERPEPEDAPPPTAPASPPAADPNLERVATLQINGVMQGGDTARVIVDGEVVALGSRIPGRPVLFLHAVEDDGVIFRDPAGTLYRRRL